jgi:uncharacterized protein YcaQ
MQVQGLLDEPTRRAGPAALERLIQRLGFVQIDSIICLERAHHLTLRTRLSGYRPTHLDTLLERRLLFEHWTHDASVIPVQWLSHWPHRFKRDRKRILLNAWWAERIGGNGARLCRSVKARIRREGPLRSADFEHQPDNTGSWWGWKPAKAALEYLWRCGELAVSKRDPSSFQKWYDLQERVLGSVHASTATAHVDWACGEALDRLGTATAAEVAGFFSAVPLATARAWCAKGLANGSLIEVDVERLDAPRPVRCVARPNLAQAAKRASTCNAIDGRDSIRLLCPFDPVIRDRKRLKRLFNFDYRFEAFVPAAKRVFGYYVLPMLEGDRLIGRVDLKTDRQEDVLRVKGVWWEDGFKATRRRKSMLDAELESLAAFVGVSRVG